MSSSKGFSRREGIKKLLKSHDQSVLVTKRALVYYEAEYVFYKEKAPPTLAQSSFA